MCDFGAIRCDRSTKESKFDHEHARFLGLSNVNSSEFVLHSEDFKSQEKQGGLAWKRAALSLGAGVEEVGSGECTTPRCRTRG
jgi:hypothetical protein